MPDEVRPAEAGGWLDLSTRDEGKRMRGQFGCPDGAYEDLEGCPNLLCSCGPLPRGVDESGALGELDGHEPSVMSWSPPRTEYRVDSRLHGIPGSEGMPTHPNQSSKSDVGNVGRGIG